MTDMLWYSAELASSEHFRAELRDDGPRLQGTVVLPIDGRPAHLNYEVSADRSWRTRRADVEIERPDAATSVAITADGEGHWVVDSEPAPTLDGCLDIDLGWTPATNTLQIRRLGLGVGERQTLAVAWMRFPELVVERNDQTYERIGPTTWRYSSGDFDAILEVDGDGFVRRYGDDLWLAIAATESEPRHHG